MGVTTGIEWTDATWNPILGCSRVSEGCRNCYAERLSARFVAAESGPYSGLTQMAGSNVVWTGRINETRQLLKPLHWRKPKRIFVNSMSDLFHENVTDGMLDRIFAVMALCPQHTFQVLTKRPERMLAYLGMVADEKDMQRWVNAALELEVGSLLSSAETWQWPLRNLWLGVSVENQKCADERIPLLLQTPAAVRFISVEPLLGSVGLARLFPSARGMCNEKFWVICGGESGPGARPMDPDWARSLRDQCVDAGVPFYFKQWGPREQGNSKGGCVLDGREWKQFPAVVAEN